MPIPIRSDFGAPQLRVFARKTKDGPQARRLLALAAIYDGATRTEAARIGGVTLQIVRDWVVKFNSHGPDGLIDRKARPIIETERQAPCGDREGDRGWPDPGDSRRRALAACRSLSMDIRGVLRDDRQADPEPGAARHGVSQTFCPPAPSCADGRGNRGF